MLVMAYCLMAQGRRLREQLLKNKTVNEAAKRYNVKLIQILLPWVVRTNDVICNSQGFSWRTCNRKCKDWFYYIIKGYSRQAW